jgi:tetratricopeptide (TPR) repeat protein
VKLAAFVLLLTGCSKPVEPPKEPAPKNLAEYAERLGRKITDDGARSMLMAQLGLAFVTAGRAQESVPYLVEAQQMSTRLSDPNDREAVLTALAHAQALGGEIGTAKETAKLIGAPDTRSEALAQIVEQIAAAKNFDAARELIAAIPEAEWKGTAEVYLVKGILASGQREQAGQMAARIAVRERRDEATSAVAVAWFEAGNKKLGESALDGIESPHWRAEAVAATARKLYQSGRKKKAIDAAKGIESHWIRARTYAELSGMAARAGRTGEANRLLEQSIEFAEDIKDQVMRATALTDVSMRLIDRGDLDRAATVLAKAPETATRHKADAHLAGHYARTGEMEKAYRVQQVLESDVIWGSEAASQIAKAHSARGEFEKALELASKIRTRELRLPALAEIAVAHMIVGAPLEPSVMEKLERALLTGF